MLRTFTLAGLLATGFAKSLMATSIALSPTQPPPTGKTLVGIAAGYPDLSTFVTAVTAAGLVDTLNGRDMFTVFAPNNAAFAALPNGVLFNLLKPKNKAQLVKLLEYHVVAGADDARQRSKIPIGVSSVTLTAVEGDKIRLFRPCTDRKCLRGSRVFLQPKCAVGSCELPTNISRATGQCEGLNNNFADCYDVQVTTTLTNATNGNINVIDSVLKIPNTLFFRSRTITAGSCGQVDAAPRIPAVLFEPSHAAELQQYVDITVALYDRAPEKLEVGQCKDIGFGKFFGSQQATWAPPALMGPICLKQCKCNFPGYAGASPFRKTCTDQPDDPAHGTFCSLCAPASSSSNLNAGAYIQFYSKSPPPAPPAPPAPLPPSCDPRVGCTVCAACCKSYIPNGKSCDACVEKQCAAPVPNQTIVDIAVATPDLSTLVTALTAGDLVSTLQGPGPFTVFAPTNEAFAKIPPLYLKLLLDPANIKTLQRLLTYHVVAGVAAFAKDLTNGESIKTVEGQNVVVTISRGTVKINDATVTTADVAASNGVVHIIDTVLMPSDMPSNTIVDVAAATPDLSTLVTALTAADLVSTLQGAGPFTVFAPTNEGFAALPTGVLNNLLKPTNKAQLVDVLTYHVVAGAAVLAKDLKDRQMITTVEGKAVTVRISQNDVFINSAKVTTADVGASNGVVHIIDGVLLP